MNKRLRRIIAMTATVYTATTIASIIPANAEDLIDPPAVDT